MNNRNPAGPPATAASEAVCEGVTIDRKTRGIFRDACVDLALIILSVCALIVWEETKGREFLEFQYKYFQTLLSPPPIKVAILDTCDLQTVDYKTGNGIQRVTPRDKLRALIDAVASHKPVAIALDINFAPFGDDEFVTNDDADFFDACLAHREQEQIPVFVGANWKDPSENENRRPERLLGNDRYRDLVGWIVIFEDTRKLPSGFHSVHYEMRSLSALLADAKGGGPPKKTFWSRFAESVSEDEHRHFLVDYSPLNQLRGHDFRLRSIDPQVIRQSPGEIFEDKLVLIGNATLGSAPDTFAVPMLTEKGPVPGIYLHACGANTLATIPVYELTHLGRGLLDLLLSMTVLMVVAFIRLAYRNVGSDKAAETRKERTELFFTISAVIVAFILATVFVRYSRVLWTDFFIVCLVLALHPVLKPYIVRGSEIIMGTCRDFWTWLVGGPEAGKTE
jgi:hypothetical protein